MSKDRIRDQNRLRALRKREREREARIDVQTEAIANEMPEAWRDEWRERVKRNRSRAERAKAEVEKALPAIPESGRQDFIASSRLHTKVSLAELRNHFMREKQRAEQTEEDDPAFVCGDCPEDWTRSRYSQGVQFLDGHIPKAKEITKFSPLWWGYVREREDQPGSDQPGSTWWWMFAVYGEGGFSDERPFPRHIERSNHYATAFLRAERENATACRYHSASITSRPEYWLVATTLMMPPGMPPYPKVHKRGRRRRYPPEAPPAPARKAKACNCLSRAECISACRATSPVSTSSRKAK
jgi:hypothetical protein